MFRSLCDHHQAFLRIKSINAGYMLGSQRRLQLVPVQCKPLIMIILGPALFDNNNRLITLSGGIKICIILLNLLLQSFTCIKNNNIYFNN
jgi:hypothetical protein